MSNTSFVLDSATIEALVHQTVQSNIISTIENMVQDVNWLARIEKLIEQNTQEKTLARINSVDVEKLITEEIDKKLINVSLSEEVISKLINQIVQDKILKTVENINQDSSWLTRIENIISQTIALETIARVGSIDINSTINQRIDKNYKKFREGFNGINDESSQVQLTIMDDVTVVENILTAREINILDGATINNLSVKGSINTDNESWNVLAKNISEKTLEQLSEQWKEQLIEQTVQQIKNNGIAIDDVKVGGESFIIGNTLGAGITESHLQTVGTLRKLSVAGEANFNNTLAVANKRIGINTDSPEMSLSVWDEEVSISVGKFKLNQAYIGTTRQQGLSLGVNRIPQLDISIDGITTVKKLRIGVHMISHDTAVPGWSGTRGDIVFNANPKEDLVFAWVCLGGFKWQVLKSAV
jgi:hypothetical protein